MLQIYVLVVAVNALMGILIVLGKFREDVQGNFLHGNIFTLTLTIIAFMIALFCLIAPYGQSGLSAAPLLGDFLPTIITVAGALVFLTRYIKQNHPDKIESNNFFLAVDTNEYYVGIACVAIAIIHFLFPGVLFL